MATIVQTADITAWFQAAKNVTLTSAQNVFLALIQPWVETVVGRVVGYEFVQGTYTEFLPPTGGERQPIEFGIDIGWDMVGGVAMPRSRMDPGASVLQLTKVPVRSVASVYENLAAWVAGTPNGDWPTALPARSYRLDMSEPDLCKNGQLIRLVGSWITSPRCVKVTYTFGYTQAEIDASYGDIKMAVLEGLGWWWGKAMQRSNAIRSNMNAALQLTIRDFSVALGPVEQLGQGPGQWAQNVLGPTALLILLKYVNMAQYFR